MNSHADDGRARQLEAVLGLVRTRTTSVQRDVLERFVVRYFGQVGPGGSRRARVRGSLRGGAFALELRQEAARWATPACVSSTRRSRSTGWQSTHTIIEIVNDDMPFLVDSVTMEVNRQGLTLHLIVHPIIAVLRGKGRDTFRRRSGGGGRRDTRILHPRRGRPDDGSLAPRGPRHRRRARARRRAHGGDRLEEDEGQASLCRRRDRRAPAADAAEELDEAKAFLSWLANDHYTLLAYRCTIWSSSTARMR
jgi:glutamate dehydrogenase